MGSNAHALITNRGYDIDDDYAEIGEQLENVVKFDPEWEIDRNKIQILGTPIGRGQFGSVYKAKYRNAEAEKLVAIKSTHNESNEKDAEMFIDEARVPKNV